MAEVAIALMLLVGAGLIEGFVSPDPRVPFTARIAIGVGYFALMVAFLSGRLWGQRTVPESIGAPPVS